MHEEAKPKAPEREARKYEKADPTQYTQEQLKIMKAQAIGQELKMLQEDMKVSDKKEKTKRIWDRFKGLFTIAILGRFMSKEEQQEVEEDAKDVHVTGNEDFVRPDISEAEFDEPEDGEIEVDDVEIPLDDEVYGEPTRSTRALNLTNGAKKFYNADGTLNKKTKAKLESGELTMEDIPAPFVIQERRPLKEGMPSTYEEFKGFWIQKLYPNVKDHARAVELTTNVLRSSALGAYQVLPKYHFKKIGLESRGEQGLMDMYRYLSSPKLQFELMETSIKKYIKKYGQEKYSEYDAPVLVAIQYYSGHGGVNRYIKNMDDPGLKAKAFAGHGSVIDYRDSIMKKYDGFKAEGFSQYEAIAMAIEKTESGGSGAKKVFLARRQKRQNVALA